MSLLKGNQNQNQLVLFYVFHRMCNVIHQFISNLLLSDTIVLNWRTTFRWWKICAFDKIYVVSSYSIVDKTYPLKEKGERFKFLAMIVTDYISLSRNHLKMRLSHSYQENRKLRNSIRLSFILINRRIKPAILNIFLIVFH